MDCDQILNEISETLMTQIDEQEKKIQYYKDKKDFNSNMELATAIGKHLAMLDTHNHVSVLMSKRAVELQKQNLENLKNAE